MINLMDRAFAFGRLAELMPEARARFGVRELAVFGSVARGDASEASDLDSSWTSLETRPSMDSWA